MLGIEALVFFMENEFQKKNRLTNLAFCVIYWTAGCVPDSLFLLLNKFSRVGRGYSVSRVNAKIYNLIILVPNLHGS